MRCYVQLSLRVFLLLWLIYYTYCHFFNVNNEINLHLLAKQGSSNRFKSYLPQKMIIKMYIQHYRNKFLLSNIPSINIIDQGVRSCIDRIDLCYKFMLCKFEINVSTIFGSYKVSGYVPHNQLNYWYLHRLILLK